MQRYLSRKGRTCFSQQKTASLSLTEKAQRSGHPSYSFQSAMKWFRVLSHSSHHITSYSIIYHHIPSYSSQHGQTQQPAGMGVKGQMLLQPAQVKLPMLREIQNERPRSTILYLDIIWYYLIHVVGKPHLRDPICHVDSTSSKWHKHEHVHNVDGVDSVPWVKMPTFSSPHSTRSTDLLTPRQDFKESAAPGSLAVAWAQPKMDGENPPRCGWKSSDCIWMLGTKWKNIKCEVMVLFGRTDFEVPQSSGNLVFETIVDHPIQKTGVLFLRLWQEGSRCDVPGTVHPAAGRKWCTDSYLLLRLTLNFAQPPDLFQTCKPQKKTNLL